MRLITELEIVYETLKLPKGFHWDETVSTYDMKNRMYNNTLTALCPKRNLEIIFTEDANGISIYLIEDGETIKTGFSSSGKNISNALQSILKEKIMKLTKDTLIEGIIVKAGTEIRIHEKDSKAQDKEDSAQYAKYMKDFKNGKLKDGNGNIVKSKDQAIAISKAKSEGDDN